MNLVTDDYVVENSILVEIKNKTSNVFIVPEGVEKLPDYIFVNSLFNEIILPESLINIGKGAFNDCINLKELNIPKNVTFVGSFPFENCVSLKKIIINSNVFIDFGRYIDENAEIIYTFDNDKNSFYVEFMGVHFKELNDLKKEVYAKIKKYVKYDFEKFHINTNSNMNISVIFAQEVSKIMNINDISIKEEYINTFVNKFSKVFEKTRINDFVDPTFFDQLTLQDIEKFNLKIYRKLITSEILSSVKNRNIILYAIYNFFGLFENDNNLYNRLNYLIKMLDSSEYNYKIDEYTLQELFINDKESFNFNKYYDQEKEKYYVLKENKSVAFKLSAFMGNRISKTNLDRVLVQFSKVVRNDYMNIILDNYDLLEINTYTIKKDLDADQKKEIYIKLNSIRETVDYFDDTMFAEIFARVNVKYNEKTYLFFKNNLSYFVNSKNYINNIRYIMNNFNEFCNNYNNLSFGNYVSYAGGVKFNNKPGFEDFALKVKNSGVINDDVYSDYENLYSVAKFRNKNCIPKLSETEFQFEEEKYTVELLSMHDPFLIYMSESNYFKNCQVYNNNGYSCLKHLALSNDSRAFILKKILDSGEQVLIAQSFLWQNENILCFDNIELHPNITHKKELRKKIFNIYELWANIIMKSSNGLLRDKVNKLLDSINLDNIDESIKILKKSKELTSKQIINTVVVGSNESFVSNMGAVKVTVNDIRPKNYRGYTDTKEVYLLAGNPIINEFDKTYVQYPIYDEKDEILVRINKKN